MATKQATQRDKVIQAAKFPSKPPITAYQLAKREIQDYLSSGKNDLSHFDFIVAKLEGIIDTDEVKRDAARKDLACINSFRDLMKTKKFSKYTMGLKKVDVPLTVGKVKINVRLDVALTEKSKDDVISAGGIILFTARSEEGRKNIAERRRQISQLILWGLEGYGNFNPLPRLCMSMDLHGQALVKATNVSEQYRTYVRGACQEAELKWDSVSPPKDYDGPNWQ